MRLSWGAFKARPLAGGLWTGHLTDLVPQDTQSLVRQVPHIPSYWRMWKDPAGPWVDLCSSSLMPIACWLLAASSLVHWRPFLLSSTPACPHTVPLPKGQRTSCSQLRAELNLGAAELPSKADGRGCLRTGPRRLLHHIPRTKLR